MGPRKKPAGRFVCFAYGAWGDLEGRVNAGETSGSAKRHSSGLQPAGSEHSGSGP
jgi:hypothetical protein